MRLLFFDRSKLQEHSEYGLDGLARLSVSTMATFIWKIGCSFCVRLKSIISITSLSEFSPGGGGAVDNLDPQMVSFFFVICLRASVRHHDHFISLKQLACISTNDFFSIII